MLEIGDVVQLKSGGLSMSVSSTGNIVTCIWLDTLGHIQSGGFHPALLKKVDGGR